MTLRRLIVPIVGLAALVGCSSDETSACDQLADLAERVQDGDQSPSSSETFEDLRMIAEQAIDEGSDAAQAAQGVLIDLDTIEQEPGGEDRLAGTLTNMIDACGL